VNPQSARDLRFLLAAMGLNSLPLGYTLVVLPIYLSEIGFSGTIIGAVSSVSAIANTIALIPFALAADKYGRKQFAVWGFLSATLAHILFAFTRDLNLLLLASAIGGVGLAGGFSAAVWTPAWTAMLAEKVSEEERTRAFAWSQGIWTIALTVGSGMGVLPAFLRSNFRTSFLVSFQYTFLIFAGLAILSGLLLFPIVETSPFPARSYRQKSKKFFPNKSLGQISKFSLTIGLVGLASGIALQLLSLWFKKMYGVNEAVLGPWFAAAEITSLAVVPVAPRLTKNLGSPKSVLTTQGLSAILLGSMVLAPTYQLAGIIFIVRNFFMNISWPVQQSYLMGTVTAEERASASAITSTIWGIGSSIGPIFAGYLLNRTDYASTSAPLLIGSATYLVSAVVFYFFFRRTPPPEEVKSRFSTEIA
jgi:MFS family permease